jgi:hypothetical protein
MRSKFRASASKILSALKQLATPLSTPLLLASSFCVLATGSSVVAALWEGRLVGVEHVNPQVGVVLTVIPFSRNISTLVDFLILNPLVIFFLQRSHLQKRRVEAGLGLANPIPPYHRFGLCILSACLGIYGMKFYVTGSQFFDATMVPGKDGRSTITATGWIVYSWTALYMAGVCYAVIEQGVHASRVITLSERKIPYEPFHPDNAAGVRFIMEPTLSFAYAMIGLLLTFVVFIVHDKILYHIESNRLWAFAIYIVLVLPLFGLPFYHLHRLMKQRSSEYLLDLTTVVSGLVFLRRDDRSAQDWTTVKSRLAAMEELDKYRKTVSSFPVWPVSIPLALPPLMSIAAAAFPLAKKFLLIAFPTIASSNF